MNTARAAQAYAAFFARLRPADLEGLETLFRPDARFRDPFNDVHGPAAIRRVFTAMFAHCVEPRFQVHEVATVDDTAYLLWTFTFRPRRGRRPWRIEGVSRVRFDADGRVREHVDHWDAASQLYARLPLLGALLRAVARRLAA